jgi:hypothetical protein
MIYDKASLVQIPSGYKSGTLYSVVPNTADGDFTVTGDPEGEATRVNKDGLIESVAADVPRLNYDPSNPQDPHLLLEPTRTNQFTNSENLANIDFKTNSTITTDNIIAPNGSLTADKTTQTSGGYLRETVSVSNGTTYSFSVFLKKGDLRYAVIRSLFSQNGTTPANSNNVFDLDNGSVIYTGTDIVSASIEAYTNDWYRCSFVSLASGTSSASFIDFYFTSSSSSTQASGTAGSGYAWGMQLEAGTYPTSYIPTTGAVTRTVDKCLNAGDANLFNDSEGTLFVDLENFSGNTRELTLSDGTSNNRITIIFYGASAIIRFYVANGGVAQADSVFSISFTFDQRNKIAFRYKQNDFKAYINGTQVFSDTSGNTPVGLSRFDFANSNATTNFIEGEIYQAMVFNEALSDSELETITSYTSFNQMAKALLYTIE